MKKFRFLSFFEENLLYKARAGIKSPLGYFVPIGNRLHFAIARAGDKARNGNHHYRGNYFFSPPFLWQRSRKVISALVFWLIRYSHRDSARVKSQIAHGIVPLVDIIKKRCARHRADKLDGINALRLFNVKIALLAARPTK